MKHQVRDCRGREVRQFHEKNSTKNIAWRRETKEVPEQDPTINETFQINEKEIGKANYPPNTLKYFMVRYIMYPIGYGKQSFEFLHYVKKNN